MMYHLSDFPSPLLVKQSIPFLQKTSDKSDTSLSICSEDSLDSAYSIHDTIKRKETDCIHDLVSALIRWSRLTSSPSPRTPWKAAQTRSVCPQTLSFSNHSSLCILPSISTQLPHQCWPTSNTLCVPGTPEPFRWTLVFNPVKKVACLVHEAPVLPL
jgi:hypothetical protein